MEPLPVYEFTVLHIYLRSREQQTDTARTEYKHHHILRNTIKGKQIKSASLFRPGQRTVFKSRNLLASSYSYGLTRRLSNAGDRGNRVERERPAGVASATVTVQHLNLSCSVELAYEGLCASHST